MVSKMKNPDWPPPGWKVNIKTKNGRKYKYYINSKTRQKFYSKPSVLRYIKDGCVSNEKSQPVIEHAKKGSGMQMHLAEEYEFDWLPTGWVVERRIRKSGARAGTEYKCYIDPSSGTKFFSKPEVFRYLGSKHCIAGSSKRKDKKGSRQSSSKRLVDPLSAHKSNLEPKVSQISKTRVRKSLSSGNLKVVTERTVDEDLPSGWIKETRIKMLRNKVVRRDPFYNDPASRLVFRSKLEVLRYVETGEISRHAYRRKKGSITGEDSANGKTSTSSEHEETPKTKTRKKLFAGEAGSGQSIQQLPEAVGDEKVEVRKSKRLSSSKVRPAPAGASSKQLTWSPKSASISQETLLAKPLLEKISGTKETLDMTKHAPSEVQDAAAEVATLKMGVSSSASSSGILPEENQVALAIQDCSNGIAETSKRKSKDRKLPCIPSRSSKRLAGVEAKVVYHPIPIEHALRATNRMSRTNKLQGKKKDVDTQVWNDHALQASCGKPSRTKPIPSLESVPNELQVKCQDVDKLGVLAIQEEKHQTLDVHAEIVPTTQGEPSAKIDDLPSEEKHRALDFSPETVITTKGGPSNKIDDLRSEEEKYRPLDVDPEAVLAAHVDALNKGDNDLIRKNVLLVDVNDLQLEQPPPGFSESTTVEVSSIRTKESLEHPSDTCLVSKVENTSRGKPILEEKLTSIDMETEQPQSEFCFPSPLWSDPCLEFAFKTLTGAIPFDDNLAIQDYIQHQLRTTEESDNNQCLPDVCASSVFKSDETKIVSQSPEEANVPNSNGFGSSKTKQVKNK